MEPSSPNITSLSLPVVSIQPTFTEVVQEVEEGIIPSEQIWVSCYKTNEPSAHAKFSVELDERDRDLVLFTPIKGSNEGQTKITRTGNNFSVSCEGLGIPPTRVLSAVQEYRDTERCIPTRPQSITAFDISPDMTRFAAGFNDGSVNTYPISPLKSTSGSVLQSQAIDVTQNKTPSRPHLSAVGGLTFLPSSQVLLTSGNDFSLTILSADLPNSPNKPSARVHPARTLRSHTRPISATAVIGAGRNIVSASLDGSVKLWDVPSGEVIFSIRTQSQVTSMVVADRISTPPDGEDNTPSATETRDPREIPEVKDKILICGLKNGRLEILDLGLRKSVYLSPAPKVESPLNTVIYDSVHHILSTGSDKGLVSVYDSRSLDTPLTSFSRLEAGVNDLAFVDGKEGESRVYIAVASGDGLPFVASVVPEGPMVAAELVGVDCDAVRHIRARRTVEGRTEIWTASDDCVIRRYVY
ncbi:hypothetical protein CVT24_005164 [Panaeolus cyanescens]|uniref:Uncharacterized protein n=1 Tax=Panaeolus cyanescens TaxID=181874 RepID=A0A409Y8X1_9AGAR|nr:hypothetical protein CVT24_005164 [Panaeolus cyanescens]